MAMITYPPRGGQQNGDDGTTYPPPGTSWLDPITPEWCCSLDANEKWALVNYYLTLILAQEGGTDYTNCTSLLALVNSSGLRGISMANAESYILASVMSVANEVGAAVPATLAEARAGSECLRRSLTRPENQALSSLLWALIVHEMTP